MGLPKGKTNNVYGRPKGSSNKNIAPVREKFQQLLDGYPIELMQKDLKQLEPQERLRIIGSLAEFLIPKLQRSEVKTESEVTIQQSMVIGGKKILF